MKVYVVMRFRPWDGALELAKGSIVSHLPVRVDCGKSCGFLACYESLEALREEYPDASFAEMLISEEADNG